MTLRSSGPVVFDWGSPRRSAWWWWMARPFALVRLGLLHARRSRRRSRRGRLSSCAHPACRRLYSALSFLSPYLPVSRGVELPSSPNARSRTVACCLGFGNGSQFPDPVVMASQCDARLPVEAHQLKFQVPLQHCNRMGRFQSRPANPPPIIIGEGSGSGPCTSPAAVAPPPVLALGDKTGQED